MLGGVAFDLVSVQGVPERVPKFKRASHPTFHGAPEHLKELHQ